MEQNNLLRTLTVLWERLCSEVIIFSDFELIYLNKSSLITRIHFFDTLPFLLLVFNWPAAPLRPAFVRLTA